MDSETLMHGITSRDQFTVTTTAKKSRRGSTEKGVRLVSGSMLVRIQSSALKSRWCNGQHKTLLRSWSWFESRLGN